MPAIGDQSAGCRQADGRVRATSCVINAASEVAKARVCAKAAAVAAATVAATVSSARLS